MHASACYHGDVCLSGAVTGDVYKWMGNTISGVIQNHNKLVDAIAVTATGVFTGGRDNKIVQMDSTYTVLSTIDTAAVFVGSVEPSPRAISFFGDQIFVGTKGAEIYSVNLAQPAEMKIVT